MSRVKMVLSLVSCFTLMASLGCSTTIPAECSEHADCEAGHVCDADARCVPATVGLECEDAEDCADDLECADHLPGGYCTRSCSSNDDCPPGSACVVLGGEGFCMAECDGDGDCRDDYVCSGGVCNLPCEEDEECPGGHVCVDGKCVGSEVGLPCAEDGDCGDDLDCTFSEHGGYCTNECENDDDCPTGSFCGYLFGEKVCLAACRADEDCGQGQTCHRGGCIIPCTDDEQCPGELYCGDNGACREGGDQEIIDLGEVQPGTQIEVETGPEASSLTLVVYGQESATYQFTSITDPEGTERITGSIGMGWGGDMMTDPHRTMPRTHSVATQIPNNDMPDMQMIPGTWSFSFDGGPASALAVVRTGDLDDGTVDLNIFVAPQAFGEGVDASNLADEPHFHVIMDEWEHYYVDQANLSVGEVRFFDLPAKYTDIEMGVFTGDMPYEEMFMEFGRDDGLNAFFVRSISAGFLGDGVAGVSGGIPGPPIAETRHSGVVMQVQDQPRFTGLTLAHEAGHFMGLFHLSEQFGDIHDQISDTPQCDSVNDASACPEARRYIMFPALDPNMELLSPAQAEIVRASATVR